MRGLFTRDRLVLAALLATLGVTYFTVPNFNGDVGGAAELDGYYYYIYLRSLLVDGDIDFTNEYFTFGNTFGFGRSDTGRAINIFGIGPAVMWAPFFLVVHLLALLGTKLGFALSAEPMTRFHLVGTFFASTLMGWASVVLTYRFVRRALPGPSGGALLAALAAALAGPLPFYCLALASFSHAPATMLSSLLLLLWLRWRGALTLRRWLVWGGVGGLLALVRPACAPFLLVPLVEGLRPVVAALRRRAPGDVPRLLVGPLCGVAAAFLVFVPQMVVWDVLFGRPLLVPQGPGFMRWGESSWAATLFSPRNGLFTSAPLMAVAMLALAVRAVRAERALILPLLGVVAGMAVMNGAAHDWWGWSFSARRFTSAMPIFALGLGVAVRALARAFERRPARAAAWVAGLVAAGFVVFNLQWMMNHGRKFMTWSNLRSTQSLYMTVIHSLVDNVYETVGNPMSLPSSLAFTLRRGGSPTTYDRVSGHFLLGEAHEGANPAADPEKHSTLILPQLRYRPYLSRSFGVPQTEGAVTYVPLREPRGQVFLPINRPGDLGLLLGGRALHPNTVVEARWNGTVVGRQELLDRAWSMISFDVPARLVDRGINRLDLVHRLPRGWDRPARDRVIGATGVTSPVDLAAVSGAPGPAEFAEVWVAGRKVTQNQRGLNVVLVDPTSGGLLGVRAFDTYLRPGAHDMMAEYLAHFPSGTIVAMATRGNVQRYFGASARTVFASVGCAVDLARLPNTGYAAIGVLGAPPWTGEQQARAVGHARVHVGRKPPGWREVARYRFLKVR